MCDLLLESESSVPEDFIDSLIIKHEDNISSNDTMLPDKETITGFYANLNVPELIVYAISMGHLDIIVPRDHKIYSSKMIKCPAYVEFYTGRQTIELGCSFPTKCDKILGATLLKSINYGQIWDNIKTSLCDRLPKGVSGIITEYMLLKSFR